MKQKNARRVERLHGELYRALADEAGRLGCRPATLAAHILQVEAARRGLSGGQEPGAQQGSGDRQGLGDQRGQGKQRGAGAQSAIHPLAEAYLPRHNPRPAEGERARMLTITAPEELFCAFFEQAQSDAVALGYKRPPGFGADDAAAKNGAGVSGAGGVSRGGGSAGPGPDAPRRKAGGGEAEPPEVRDFRRVVAERYKLLLVSCFVAYLERVGCL